MLEYLRIQNFALLEEVELELAPGLTVITGETGAGKSILVGAIGALRGGRMNREMIRDGAPQATVEAVIRPDAAIQAAPTGAGEGDDALVVTRVYSAAGRSRQRMDGELVPAARLAERIAPLMDISSQHDGQSLTDPSTHLGLLDAAGVDPASIDEMRGAFEELAALLARIRELGLDDRERAQRLDLLSFQLAELEALRPEAGEEEGLQAERRRLAGAADLEQATRSAVAELYEDEEAVTDRLGRAQRGLDEAVGLDPRLAPLAERLEEVRVQVDDAVRELRSYADAIEADPARLEAVESRLEDLRRLCRKHGESVAGLAELRSRLAGEIEDLRQSDQRLETLRADLESARRRAGAAAEALTRARQKASRRLGRAVGENLERLGMPGAEFRVVLGHRAGRRGDEPDRVLDGRRLGPDGWDRAEFHIAPNPGEEAMPISRTASGGELSRIMLAIKLVLADRDRVACYVFDEVDAGIGGTTADAVGRALADVASHRQVLCITHLAAIAAFADHHLVVKKRQAGGRTVAELTELEGRDRIEEVARMLGGAKVTPPTRAAAADLIQRARGRRGRAAEGARSKRIR